jgi:hypothetical protein
VGRASGARGGESKGRLGLDAGQLVEDKATSLAARGVAGNRQRWVRWHAAIVPLRHHRMRACAGRTRLAMDRHGPLARGPLNFSLNIEINTNFEIQNEGLAYVQKYSNFVSLQFET